MLLVIIILLSLLFIAIGFGVNERNAKYLLAGYNTMSEAERAQYDLSEYIPKFKHFHIMLGISMMSLGLVIHFLFGEIASGIFLGIYPILAYIYFIYQSKQLIPNQQKGNTKWGLAVLIFILIGIIGLFYFGFKENELKIQTNQIEITGQYGEQIDFAQLKTIELVDSIPKIAYKSNGFSLGDIHKGYYKTKAGESIKLILNAKNKPYILLTKTDNTKVYYSLAEGSNQALMQVIKAKTGL